MDSQQVDYWTSQKNVNFNTSIFDIHSDLSSFSSPHSSPMSPTYESFPTSVYQTPYNHLIDNFAYPMPLTPSDFGSTDDGFPLIYENPPQALPQSQSTDLMYPNAERTHSTSGRRRAQNRAAQRAFRERKEKHAKDLERQLAAMTEKYRDLENNHGELSANYEKLRKTIELLTKDETNSDTLRKLLEILHGGVKQENGGGDT
ncbi:hypothetical protein B0A49_11968 [Cryomyces minteri]|uniref:BZIP domain-containing protein n=1 Tax=Cryomyces minteri TaxID=331657 RepID=A0A4U0W621_9PEZI|nr:hypothetical protein B0A49_11968 [Cryomyces minteri]